jgi:serine-type D-Ala-D-Ala carboxypeptidase/endopeptidase (penicillin-binding protein 4)
MTARRNLDMANIGHDIVISRRQILTGLMAGLAGPVLAEGMPSSLRPKARPVIGATASAPGASPGDYAALIKAANLGGTVAYVLADAATGEVLMAREADHPMPPASVAKTLTSLFALEKLGATHRFRTRILATGPVQGGIVQGDILLAGGGDPTLDTDKLGDLVARLAGAGIKGATGRFLYWDAALPGLPYVSKDQPLHVGYNPAIGGLNLNFNRVHFEWKRDGNGGWTTTMDARGERFMPAVDMARMRVADRAAPLFTFAEDGAREDWTVAAAALGKGGSRWLPVRHPGPYAAEVFRTLARAQGITLKPGTVARGPAGTDLDGVSSEALTEVLRDMLKFSTNLTAEVVGLTASGARDLASSGAVMSDWARTAFGISASFGDHSGLGAASRITAAEMARVLVASHREGRGLKPVLRDIGMRDDKGRADKGSPVKVAAKSGTLNFVSGLAGHISAPGKPERVFAIFSGDPARRDAVPMGEREEPEGVKAWTGRARRLQGQLIRRWAEV